MWHRGGALGKGSQAKGEREDAAGDSPAPDKHAAATPVGKNELQAAPAAAPEAAALPGAWRMGLVVTASALCGGIAVVLWNRRLLTKMREVAPVKREEYREQQGRLWEDDV